MIKVLLTLLFLISCEDEISVDKKPDDFQSTQPVEDCVVKDENPPVLASEISLEASASVQSTPKLSWQKASEDCEFSHYEIAIGTSQGGEEILTYKNIGNVTSIQERNITLDYQQDYFVSLRGVDRAGNYSSVVVSKPFQPFTAQSLTNMVVWLDVAKQSSVLDHEGDQLGSTTFNNVIKSWQDISNSVHNHHFNASNAQTSPHYDVIENGISFNGSNQLFMTADHPDINTSDIAQRTLVASIKTGDDIQTRQVVYEEGGTVRGLNIYIEAGQLRCGFWNDRNDGDGTQPFIEVKTPIEAEKKYQIVYLFDYAHFQDENSPDGTIECFVNGTSIGQVASTSRLHAHSGDIGLGAMNDGSYFHDGAGSSDNYFFKGHLFEFMLYNNAHSLVEIQKLSDNLAGKWR